MSEKPTTQTEAETMTKAQRKALEKKIEKMVNDGTSHDNILRNLIKK